MSVSKEDKKWQTVYDNYKYSFPSLEEITTDWWPTGYRKILVVHNDGIRMIYDDSTTTIRNVGGIDKIDIFEDEDKWKKEFAYNLRFKLVDGHCDQKKLAEIVGVSNAAMSNYITGKTLPNAIVIVRMAKALGCSLDDLLIFGEF